MSRIETSIEVDAPPTVVWAHLADISSHVEWMADAESITFTSASRRGTGTCFDCATRVGPLTLVDRMEITEWEPDRSMGVRHVGLVTGTGSFDLTARGPSTTILTWTETLRFPWWMAGRLGAWVARPVLGAIWRGNLRRLKDRIDAPTP